jgi:hypothetical protein
MPRLEHCDQLVLRCLMVSVVWGNEAAAGSRSHEATRRLDESTGSSRIERMFDMGGDARPRAAADLLALSASKLWAERSNPIWWQCRTYLGEWLTEDRVTWRTEDGGWLAQTQRSANRRRTFMVLWHDGTYAGFQDDSGWHPATVRSRIRQPHPVVRSLPLPLPLAG